jgi:dTDP-4-dehydrorhamnose 3,5-epimerase
VNFRPTKIAGLWVIEPRVFEDTRGSFYEAYRADVFFKNGITETFVQDNHSSSARGTLRGMHWQDAPAEQAKLVRAITGEIYDVAVDLRPGSATYGRWHGETLSAQNRRMFFVPKGFAHGFLVMSDRAEVLYKASAYYAPQLERGIPWNDPGLNIEWPKVGCDYILSDRDRQYPPFKRSAAH